MVDEDPRDEPTQDVGPDDVSTIAESELIVGGGADQAAAYVAPRELPKVEKPADDELPKVKIADAVNPRRLPTLKGVSREDAIAAGSVQDAAKLEPTPPPSAAEREEVDVDVDEPASAPAPARARRVEPVARAVEAVAPPEPASGPGPFASAKQRSEAPAHKTPWQTWFAAGAIGLGLGLVVIYLRPWESAPRPSSSTTSAASTSELPSRVSMVTAPPVAPVPPPSATATAAPPPSSVATSVSVDDLPTVAPSGGSPTAPRSTGAVKRPAPTKAPASRLGF